MNKTPETNEELFKRLTDTNALKLDAAKAKHIFDGSHSSLKYAKTLLRNQIPALRALANSASVSPVISENALMNQRDVETAVAIIEGILDRYPYDVKI